MAAVMALVFMFVLGSVALFVKTSLYGLTFVTAGAVVVFAALAIGVFVSTFKQSRRWENE